MVAQVRAANSNQIIIPEAFDNLLGQRARYKVHYGGRGGAKSHNYALALLVESQKQFERILCTRELQNSIADSVHKLLCDHIDRYKFPYFHTTKAAIINRRTGSEFIFKGIKNNINDIKSTEGITKCWVEEGQNVSNDSWDVLIPTIREPDSEIWIDFNPKNFKDATFQRFVVNPPPDSIVRQINYDQNPFFPEVLRREMEYCKATNYEKYLHIWRGKPLKNSEAQVFKNKYRVEAFDTPPLEKMMGGRLFFGADFGFSNDAATLVRMFIMNKKLYIEHEMFGVGIETRDLAKEYLKVPGATRGKIYGDSSRPDTISHLKYYGFDIEAADKGPNSVEDGIAYLLDFEEIIIHPRCKNTIDEFDLYSYKVDKNTGEILRDLVDKYNHVIDAIRYGLCKYIKRQVSILDSYPT
jgi:phage terminase large subunit